MENLILKKWMMTLLIVMCLGGGVFAQSLLIEGRVNNKSGEPLPRVMILVKGTFIGTMTDENGKFVILAPVDAILVFSFEGYVTKEYPASGLNGRIIVLEEGVVEARLFFSENIIILKRELWCILREERDVI